MLPATSLPLVRRVEPLAGIEPASVRPKRTALIPLNYRGEKTWSIVSDLNRRFRHGKPVSLTNLDERCVVVIGVDRVELSPRVPKTRMHVRYTTPRKVKSLVRQQGVEP